MPVRRGQWRLASVVVVGALSAAVPALAGSASTTMTVTAIVVRGCEVTTTAQPASPVAIHCGPGVRAPRTQPAPAQPATRLRPFAFGPAPTIAPAAASVGAKVTADGARGDGQPADAAATTPAGGPSAAGNDAAAFASTPDRAAGALTEPRYRVVTIEF